MHIYLPASSSLSMLSLQMNYHKWSAWCGISQRIAYKKHGVLDREQNSILLWHRRELLNRVKNNVLGLTMLLNMYKCEYKCKRAVWLTLSFLSFYMRYICSSIFYFGYLRVPKSLGKAALVMPFEILKTHNWMLTLFSKPVISLASISDFMHSAVKESRAEGLLG